MKYKYTDAQGQIYKFNIFSSLHGYNTNTCCGIREFGNFLGLSLQNITCNGIEMYEWRISNAEQLKALAIADPFLHVKIILTTLRTLRPRKDKIDIAYVPDQEKYAPAAIALQLEDFHEVARSKSNHGRYMNVVYMRKGE